jgi:hypothetical protein
LTPSNKIGGRVAGVAVLCAAIALCGYSRSIASFARKSFAPHSLRPRAANDRMNALPTIIFWAWERSEDLRFLNPRQSGVAFLAETIYLQPAGDGASKRAAAGFVVRRRLQPLRVGPDAALIAVVRMETPVRTPLLAPADLTADQRDALASEIAGMQSLPGVRAVQIDFDATLRERAFYFALLQDVRRKLPPSMPLSVTALASWCLGDPWLSQLPPGTIDEAVPMLFRMGIDSANVARFLHASEEFPVAACQSSLGLSTDEPLSHELLTKRLAGIPSDWREKRIYVFAPRAWTPASVNSVLQEWQP